MKRTAGLVICFLIILGMLVPGAAYATEQPEMVAYVYQQTTVDNQGKVTFEEPVLHCGSLKSAADYLFYGKQGGAIVLSNSVRLESGITIHPVNGTASYILINGNVTIDLNGYSITQQAGGGYSANAALVVPSGSSLVITDSSEKGTGTVNGVQFGVEVNGGAFELSGGRIKAQSQASFFPDDAEVALKIINNGSATLNGGSVMFHGALDDGRTYDEKSCAILADETGKLTVNGGKIEGEISISESNFVIKGGTFDFDVTPRLPWLYGAVYHKGNYTVQSHMPKAYGIDCIADSKVTIVGQYPDETVDSIEINVTAEDAGSQNIKVDITEIINAVRMSGQEKSPRMVVYTDAVEIILDSSDMDALVKGGQGKKVILGITKNLQMSAEITEKMKNAMYELSFDFTDDEGNTIASEIEGLLTVRHKMQNAVNGIQLYRFDGKELKKKTSSLRMNDIICRAKNGERLVVVEGIAMMITGRSLELRGTTSIVFYAELSGVNLSQVRMLFWDSPQSEYTVKTAQRSVEYSSKDANGYKFVYSGLSAKEMSKMVYARLYARDMNGNEVYGSVPKSGYGVTTYASNMMKNPKLKPLLVKMLNYGTEMQKYYGSEDALANDILRPGEKYIDYSVEYQSTAETIPEENENGKCLAKINGKTLILEGDISISYYVYPGESVDEMGVLFWTEDAFKSTNAHILGTQSRKVNEWTRSGDYFVYNYSNIASNQMFDNIYARVYVKKDGVYQYSDIEKYSVKDYAANQISKKENAALINLLRAMLVYGQEAKNFFG